MNAKIWRHGWLLVLAAMLLTACAGGGDETAQENTPAERPPVAVEVSVVQRGNIAATLSFAGDLQAEESLSLPSIVPGVVEEVLVGVGDYVRAGDPLMRIEDTTYRAQLKQAEAGLASAQTNLLRLQNGPREEQIALAELGLAVAELNLRRLENGPREEQIALAETGVQAAIAQLNRVVTVTDDERTVAAANLAQAEAQLRLAQFEYDKIKWAGQVEQTPQALQLQQATIAYETALAAYNLQVTPDDSDLDPLRLGIRQAELNLDLARNPFTAEDFEQAEAGVRQAELNLALARDPFTNEDFALARAGVAQAEATVALAQYQVENVVLRAPFDGIIAEVYATTGSAASPQIPAFSLVAEDLEVQVEVPENQIGQLFDDQPAALKIAAFPEQDFPALVTNIAPVADTGSRTFPVTITPADPEGQLRAGMFAEVTVLLEERANTLLVPRDAVTIIDRQSYVYVVVDDTQVELRPVTTGLTDPERVEIVEGLDGTEQIVTAGLSNLSDGARVSIVTRRQ